MNVTVHERTSVDLDLEISASAEEMEPRLTQALRAQRKNVNLKGFRPGKVPLQLVRKMHGETIAAGVAEEMISEAWREHVGDNDEYRVLGSPRITKLDFGFDSDFQAVLRFGVRPEFELSDTSAKAVRRLVRPVSDEDVEEEIERRRLRVAKLVETETPADEDSVVTIDIQEVDKESDTPIIGRRDEDQEIDLKDERLREELREAIVGKTVGDAFKVDLPHQHGEDEGHDHDDHVDRYLVTVKQVRHRLLPELDEAFVKEQTADNVETVEDFRGMIRSELEEASRRLGEDFLREEIVREMIEAHQFEVPETLVETVLDDMEEDLAKRIGGELPPDFDREGFRESRREVAVQQARWMLIQDRVVEEVGMELSDEDMDIEFERMAASGPGTADMIRQFVQAQPQLLQGIQQRALSRRLFDSLAGRFRVEEVSPEELEAQEKAASAE